MSRKIEESREFIYGIRYEGADNFSPHWGDHFLSAKEAARQAQILCNKHGHGFYPVEVEVVTYVRKLRNDEL